MISRRSFLAAVMGAIAAPSLEPKLRTSLGAFPTVPETDDIFWHYSVWDSATILPGSVVNERLLSPPVPDNFSVTSIGFHFNSDAPVKSLSEVVRAIRLGFRASNKDLLQSPLFRLPGFEPYRLPMAWMLKADSDLDIRLDSLEPVRSVDPVTLTVVLQGFVLLPKGVQRLRMRG